MGGLGEPLLLASCARCFAFARPVRISSGVVLVALFGALPDDACLLSSFSCVTGMVIRSWGGFFACWSREGSGNREMRGFFRLDRSELDEDICGEVWTDWGVWISAVVFLLEAIRLTHYLFRTFFRTFFDGDKLGVERVCPRRRQSFSNVFDGYVRGSHIQISLRIAHNTLEVIIHNLCHSPFKETCLVSADVQGENVQRTKLGDQDGRWKNFKLDWHEHG